MNSKSSMPASMKQSQIREPLSAPRMSFLCQCIGAPVSHNSDLQPKVHLGCPSNPWCLPELLSQWLPCPLYSFQSFFPWCMFLIIAICSQKFILGALQILGVFLNFCLSGCLVRC